MQQPYEFLKIIQANFPERQSNVGLHPKRLEKLEVINLEGVFKYPNQELKDMGNESRSFAKAHHQWLSG